MADRGQIPRQASFVSSTPQKTHCVIPKAPIFQHPGHRPQREDQTSLWVALPVLEDKDKTSLGLVVFQRQSEAEVCVISWRWTPGHRDMTGAACKEGAEGTCLGCAGSSPDSASTGVAGSSRSQVPYL